MFDLVPEGLEEGHFPTRKTNWVHSMDGYDKLMGYQKSTFPLAIFCSIDTTEKLFGLRSGLETWILKGSRVVI